MTAPPIVLERLTRTALLGVRFWDRVTGRSVSDGLEATEVARGVALRPSRSGVFVLHDLPGLAASAFGAGDDRFWASPPARAPIEFDVVDRERRFLPFRVALDAPGLPVRGLFAEDCGVATSPPEGEAAVPLYSAPSRVVLAGLAAVRAALWDVDADAAAAWAVLEVSAPGGHSYRGVADEKGRVAVLMPYPEPPWQTSSPPPGSRSLADQTWPLTLAVRYSPAGASPPFPDPERGEPPDLCAVLTQSPGTLLAAESPATPLGTQILTFGRELVLRTPGRSVLLVSPA